MVSRQELLDLVAKIATTDERHFSNDGSQLLYRGPENRWRVAMATDRNRELVLAPELVEIVKRSSAEQ